METEIATLLTNGVIRIDLKYSEIEKKVLFSS